MKSWKPLHVNVGIIIAHLVVGVSTQSTDFFSEKNNNYSIQFWLTVIYLFD